MLIILEIIISVLCLKNLRIRKIMNGNSVVIIKNGVIDQSAMKKVRMTVLDLVEQLRVENVFDISTVAFAVLEVNGNLSVLLKKSDQPATVKDLKIKSKPEALPLPVITDGKIINESLKALGISESQLNQKLKANLTTADKVFLMTLDRYDNINLIKMRGKS